MSNKPRVTVKCVADHYAASNERILEISGPNGGCLISLRNTTDGKLVVEAYRCDATVIVKAARAEAWV